MSGRPADEPWPARGRKRPVDVPEGEQPAPLDGIQRLWAPWRYGYIADRGDDDTGGCPFCVLGDRDPADDRESLILHRAANCYVVFNAYPYNPGHLMVVPYAHVGELGALDDDVGDELWRLGRRAVDVLTARLSCEGVNLGMNLGAAAGAGIADHLHLHVVPRWVGDTNFVSVVGATRVLPRAMRDMYDELAGAFD